MATVRLRDEGAQPSGGLRKLIAAPAGPCRRRTGSGQVAGRPRPAGSAGTEPGPLAAARQRGAVPPSGWAEAGRGEGGAAAATLPGHSRYLASGAKRRERNACPAVSREPPRPGRHLLQHVFSRGVIGAARVRLPPSFSGTPGAGDGAEAAAGRYRPGGEHGPCATGLPGPADFFAGEQVTLERPSERDIQPHAFALRCSLKLRRPWANALSLKPPLFSAFSIFFVLCLAVRYLRDLSCV
ncbi:collagen alpha-1(I) chain-like [Oxyura jamaicensis]|uniref:collagen alpha-1(I) chain-like n=1 Tax=Oxyura jamaicensis TaxID=8884 RepID=UPI0015A64DBD|nr:collagen alpha-1(I) chain-like [Oxyura jamaicensis]